MFQISSSPPAPLHEVERGGERSKAGVRRMFYFCGMKIILWGLLIYFLYNLIFKIVVPATQVASDMKQKVREMQAQQEEARKKFEQQQQYQAQAQKAAEAKKSDDYIDFEEVG